MSRVNIEGRDWGNPKFKRLAKRLGLAHPDDALIRFMRLVHHCTDQEGFSISPDDVNEIVGSDAAADALCDVGLARRAADAETITVTLKVKSPPYELSERERLGGPGKVILELPVEAGDVVIEGARGRVEWRWQNRRNGRAGGRPRTKDAELEPFGEPIGNQSVNQSGATRQPSPEQERELEREREISVTSPSSTRSSSSTSSAESDSALTDEDWELMEHTAKVEVFERRGVDSDLANTIAERCATKAHAEQLAGDRARLADAITAARRERDQARSAKPA